MLQYINWASEAKVNKQICAATPHTNLKQIPRNELGIIY